MANIPQPVPQAPQSEPDPLISLNHNPFNNLTSLNHNQNMQPQGGDISSLFNLIGQAQNINQQINIQIDGGNVEGQVPGIIGNILGSLGAGQAPENSGLNNVLQQSLNEFMASAQATDGTPAS